MLGCNCTLCFHNIVRPVHIYSKRNVEIFDIHSNKSYSQIPSIIVLAQSGEFIRDMPNLARQGSNDISASSEPSKPQFPLGNSRFTSSQWFPASIVSSVDKQHIWGIWFRNSWVVIITTRYNHECHLFQQNLVCLTVNCWNHYLLTFVVVVVSDGGGGGGGAGGGGGGAAAAAAGDDSGGGGGLAADGGGGGVVVVVGMLIMWLCTQEPLITVMIPNNITPSAGASLGGLRVHRIRSRLRWPPIINWSSPHTSGLQLLYGGL